MVKVLLTQEDFKKLTNGEVLNKGGVQIALQDIGWAQMVETIHENIRENTNFKEPYY